MEGFHEFQVFTGKRTVLGGFINQYYVHNEVSKAQATRAARKDLKRLFGTSQFSLVYMGVREIETGEEKKIS